MKIIITGGLGYIGSRLALRLLEEGHHVTIIDNASTHPLQTYEKARKPLEKFHDCFIDCTDIGNLYPDAVKGADVMFHLAAMSGVKACEESAHVARMNNVKLSTKMRDFADQMKINRFVFTSTAAVYGNQLKCNEECPTTPENRYAKTKMLAEQSIMQATETTPIIARLSNVYGMGFYDKETVLSIFTRQALKGDDLMIYGNSEQVRDFVHIDDVVDALIFLAGINCVNPPDSGIYNVGSGQVVGVKAAANMIIKECNSKSKVKHEKTVRVEPQPGYKYDVSKIKAEGWKARIKLKQGLKLLKEKIKND